MATTATPSSTAVSGTTGMPSSTATIVSFEPATQLTFKKTAEGDELEPAPVQDTLTIQNHLTDQDVLFRVQTTSPLTYRVKPSNGRIPAGQSVSIQVVMIAESTKQDKFLIKYVPISPSTPSTVNFIELFKTVEANSQEHRLKCCVLQADGNPVAYGNPSPVQSLQQQPAAAATQSTDNASVVVDEPVGNVPSVVAAAVISGGEEEQPTPTYTASTIAAGDTEKEPVKAEPSQPATPAKSNATVDPRDARIQSLQSRNQELQKQVEDLQKVLATRANGSAASEMPPEWAALLQTQTGFPPVLVVLIALFSFLVGLLF